MGQHILIIDDIPFSNICSAILELEGYKTVTIARADSFVSTINGGDFGLIIASYPYSNLIFEKIHDYAKVWDIPVLILSDSIDGDTIKILKSFRNSFCMIKPVDYARFRNIIRQVMTGELTCYGGYKIV